MNHALRSRTNARGFTLLEALVAMLVLSFGMLAIAGFQVTLTRGSDLAKQRTEAMRLAQQRMESLRSFGQVEPSVSVVNYTDNVSNIGSPDVITTNATFTRSWAVTVGPNDTERWINVTVTWFDRAGQQQSVQLLSVIARFDPQDIGTLATGPGGTNVRKPKNRNLNIPYPAVTLSGGTRSAFIPPPGNVIYVFDNTTGSIVQSCAPTPVPITALSRAGGVVTAAAAGHGFVPGNRVTVTGVSDSGFNGEFNITSVVTGTSFDYTLTGSWPAATTATGGTATLVVQLSEGMDLSVTPGITCSALDAYLLSGYVRFDTGNSPSSAEPTNSNLSRYDTLPLDVTTPLLYDTSNSPTPSLGGTPTRQCYAQRQKTVSTTSTSPVTITTLNLSGSTVTVGAAGHSFVVGDTVAINNASSPVFIGAFVVTAATPGVSFTYTLPPPLPTVTSATGGTAARLERLNIAEGTSVSGYTNVVSKFVAYACVMVPVDHDLIPATPKRWWGRMTLNPNADSGAGTTWSIGTSSGRYRICRYSADYNTSNSISNSEHPLWYRGVTSSLDSQNFLVIAHDENCPTDRVIDYLSSPVNFADDTTAAHQPTGELSFQCPSGGCGSRSVLEPSTTTIDLLMD